MSTHGKFIYGIVDLDEEKRLDFSGVGEEEIHTTCYRDISAVVSDAPNLSFDSITKEENKEEVLRHLVTYQHVAEQLMKDKGYTVIPVKFGTVVASDEDIKRILSKGYPQFKDLYKEMEGKIELDVVGLWNDLDPVFDKISEDKEISELKEEIKEETTQEALETRIKVGKLVKEKLDKKREKIAHEIKGTLKPTACDLREQEWKGLGDQGIVNLSFLVGRKHKEKFDRNLHKLDERFEGELTFKLVGPLPPYSFSTIEIKEVGFEAFNNACRCLDLGSEQLTIPQINENYQDLAQLYHPDQGEEGNPEKFQEITDAHQLLIDYFKDLPKEERKMEEGGKGFIIKVTENEPYKSKATS